MYFRFPQLVISAFILLLAFGSAKAAVRTYSFEQSMIQTPRDVEELYEIHGTMGCNLSQLVVGRLTVDSMAYDSDSEEYLFSGRVDLTAFIKNGEVVELESLGWSSEYIFEASVSTRGTKQVSPVLRVRGSAEEVVNGAAADVIVDTLHPLVSDLGPSPRGERSQLQSGDTRTHIDSGSSRRPDDTSYRGWITREGETLPREIYRFQHFSVSELPMPVSTTTRFFAKQTD